MNRPLGLLPAAASTVLIAGVTLALLNGFSVLESEREESRLSRWILQVSEPLVELLPPPWNGAPQPLPPQPIPAPDAPAMARSVRRSEPVIRSASSPIGGERAARAGSTREIGPTFY